MQILCKYQIGNMHVAAGVLTTVFAFQGFVLIITIVREAVEEMRCFLRDKEVNSQIYSKLSTRGEILFSFEQSLVSSLQKHTFIHS